MQWTVKVWWQWICLGSRGLYLQNLAVANVLLSQICDLQAGWGLGGTHWVTSCKFYGPVRSHFSKLASFENMWRGPLSRVFGGGGLPGACLLQRKVGPCAGSGRRRAPRAGPACTPRLGPPVCRAVTLSLLCFSSSCLQQTLPPVFGRMLQRIRSL